MGPVSPSTKLDASILASELDLLWIFLGQGLKPWESRGIYLEEIGCLVWSVGRSHLSNVLKCVEYFSS